MTRPTLEEIKAKSFESWLDKEHPHAYKKIGASIIVSITGCLLSCVLALAGVSYWWKIAVVSAMVLMITKVSANLFISYAYARFQEYLKNK